MKAGTLLLAKPFLGDDNFERSVVLLCRHTPAEGAFGLVLTQATDLVLADALDLPEALDAPDALSASVRALLLRAGGPVGPDTLHVVHQLAELPGAAPLGQGAYWGGDFDLLLTGLLSGAVGPDTVRLFVGYAGWAPGQLEEEIERGSWIRQPASAGKVFTLEPEALWRAVLREKGGRYRALANYPLDPRLN